MNARGRGCGVLWRGICGLPLGDPRPAALPPRARCPDRSDLVGRKRQRSVGRSPRSFSGRVHGPAVEARPAPGPPPLAVNARAPSQRRCVLARSSDAAKEMEDFKKKLAANLEASTDDWNEEHREQAKKEAEASGLLTASADGEDVTMVLLTDDTYGPAIEQNDVAVVDFFSDTCGPCRMVYPRVGSPSPPRPPRTPPRLPQPSAPGAPRRAPHPPADPLSRQPLPPHTSIPAPTPPSLPP